MSYTINKTDGTVLTEIVDGTIDQIATDLTLFGKSASAYGEHLNENFVKLLENFAKSTMPTRPVEGQLWYDAVQKRLKVYDGNVFRLTSGTLVSDYVPSSISQGDLWIDTKKGQLFFHDGVSIKLAGPTSYTTTGYTVISVVDNLGDGKEIMLLKTFDSVQKVYRLFAIFSPHTFTPLSDIEGYSGQIAAGITLVGWENNGIIPLRIKNIDDAIDLTDAVNKQTLERTINQKAPYAISLDITSITGIDKNPAIASQYLAKIFPVNEFAVEVGYGSYPVCRVVCTDNGVVTIRKFELRLDNDPNPLNSRSWKFVAEV